MTECTHTCISTPIAWFVLEQLRVGDLDPQTMQETKQHLERCSACAEAYHYIELDQVLLPPLPSREHRKPKKLTFIKQRAPHVLLAAAASLLLILGILSSSIPSPPPSPINTKGGDSALSLVRLRDGKTVKHPTHFEEGDRFRLYVTSPSNKDEWPVEVIVFQEGNAYFPYPANLSVLPGNEKSLDGAFTLTGNEDVFVCIILGDDIPSRDVLKSGTPNTLPDNSICTPLQFFDVSVTSTE